jgi:hypothetical protein
MCYPEVIYEFFRDPYYFGIKLNVYNEVISMSEKLKLWKEHSSWEEAEKAWDTSALQASQEFPLKSLKTLPTMVGITPETAKGLKWKSMKWMIMKDCDRKILKHFLKHPLKYGWALLKSLMKEKPYLRDGDFFLYGVRTEDEFRAQLKQPNTHVVVGFSYCHKPFECPSGRFTEHCSHDLTNLACRQCFIGKAVHALPQENVSVLFIPTIHYVGGQIFELLEKFSKKQLLFIITACEMTLQMFGDWGNMVGIKGVGVRLDGRICNTMKAFELSEEGIKPGLTVVTEPTQKRLLELIKGMSCKM